jgi:hypothetical protein
MLLGYDCQPVRGHSGKHLSGHGFVVKKSAPTSGYRGARGLRSGPRSLRGNESSTEFTTTPVSTIINTSRLCARHHAAPCCLAALVFTRLRATAADTSAR